MKVINLSSLEMSLSCLKGDLGLISGNTCKNKLNSRINYTVTITNGLEMDKSSLGRGVVLDNLLKYLQSTPIFYDSVVGASQLNIAIDNINNNK